MTLIFGFNNRFVQARVVRPVVRPQYQKPLTIRSFWADPGRLEKLQHLISDGISATTIASILHCTRNAVCGKRDRLQNKRFYARDGKIPEPPIPDKLGALRVDHKPRPPPSSSPSTNPFVPHTSNPRSDGLIDIVDLTSKTCRYPDGDPLQKGFGYCGQPCEDGRHYCSHHHRICYVERGQKR